MILKDSLVIFIRCVKYSHTKSVPLSGKWRVNQVPDRTVIWHILERWFLRSKYFSFHDVFKTIQNFNSWFSNCFQIYKRNTNSMSQSIFSMKANGLRTNLFSLRNCHTQKLLFLNYYSLKRMQKTPTGNSIHWQEFSALLIPHSKVVRAFIYPLVSRSVISSVCNTFLSTPYLLNLLKDCHQTLVKC